jgi:hypothetical protein
MHMKCINSFHFCLIARHIDIVIYFILALKYCENLGQSLKQEGVYATSLSSDTPDWTYYLRTLV